MGQGIRQAWLLVAVAAVFLRDVQGQMYSKTVSMATPPMVRGSLCPQHHCIIHCTCVDFMWCQRLGMLCYFLPFSAFQQCCIHPTFVHWKQQYPAKVADSAASQTVTVRSWYPLHVHPSFAVDAN